MPSPFPCSPVIRECSWKKTQIGKKKTFCSMAASVAEIYIQENQQQENLHLEAAPQS